MRQRGVVFTTILSIVTLIVTTPFVIGGFDFAWGRYRDGYGQYDFLGLDGQSWHGFTFFHSKMIHGRFYRHYYLSREPAGFNFVMFSNDPETGSRADHVTVNYLSSEFEWKFNEDGTHHFVAGDSNNFWVLTRTGYVLERDGNRFIEKTPVNASRSPFPAMRTIANQRDVFVLDGKLTAVIESTSGQRELFQLIGTEWKSLGVIKLLDTSRDWQISDNPGSLIPFKDLKPLSPLYLKPGESALGTIQILPLGSRSYLFWSVSGRLLYRPGLELLPVNPKRSESDLTLASIDGPASALMPSNTTCVASDWSLVSETIHPNVKWFPIVVGGEPAVLLVDELTKGIQALSAMRLEQGKWKEFASFNLPYPVFDFNVGSNSDGSVSYLGTEGSWGHICVYAIESTGIRKTKYEVLPWRAISGFELIAETIFWSLISGVILGTTAEVLMRRDSKKYQFGYKSVILASIWERGIARLIDLAFVVALLAGTSFGLNYAWNVDWFKAAEIRVAGNRLMAATHPDVVAASQILLVCEIALGVAMLVVIVSQARFGATPGKWVCGLRTIRTTLKPCGLARSLLREVLLCIDSMNLFSWTPGILCIAFTELRQRSGDLVADTIVVRANSLT